MKKTIIALMMIILPLFVAGQTMKEAKEAYNKGSKLFNSNKDSTLIYFEQCLSICKVVGTEGDSLRMKVESYIPSLYFDLANASYKEKKFEEALTKGQKALGVADKYKDDRNKQRCTKLISATNFALGNNAFKANDLDNATRYYEAAVSLDPKLTKAWYNMAQAYMKKGDAEKMAPAMEKTVELAKLENDTATVNKANKQCKDFYYKQALGLQKKNDLTGALSNLNKCMGYDPKNADAYYLMAVIYNKQSKSQDAINAAKNALTNETNAGSIARINYQLGFAYMNLKQNNDACEAFKKAAEAKELAVEANKILKNLKCQ
jgi:tetratricopeptide (TPR) repeat protein